MLLLETLRQAAGAPVSYVQLQEVGVEFPASVVSELELAGVAIERRHANARGARRLVGVRLDPSHDPYRTLVRSTARGIKPISTLAVLSRAASAVRERTRHFHSGGEKRITRREPTVRRIHPDAIRIVRALGVDTAKRWLALAALFTAFVAVVALVLGDLSRGGQARHVAVRHHPLRQAVSVAARSHAPTASSEARSAARPPPQQVNRPAPTPVSAALAAQLDAQGHDLLGAGRYGNAIAVLERVLAATGERLQDCLRPTSETCLIYAYALYDLGSALRLDGQPAAAVPVLRRRLQIDNQRPIVQAQLELALGRAS
jgi:hypothetical protein